MITEPFGTWSPWDSQKVLPVQRVPTPIHLVNQTTENYSWYLHCPQLPFTNKHTILLVLTLQWPLKSFHSFPSPASALVQAPVISHQALLQLLSALPIYLLLFHLPVPHSEISVYRCTHIIKLLFVLSVLWLPLALFFKEIDTEGALHVAYWTSFVASLLSLCSNQTNHRSVSASSMVHISLVTLFAWMFFLLSFQTCFHI